MSEDTGEKRVPEATREHEEREAQAAHVADRRPTPQEEEAAAEQRTIDPEVAEHEREMGRRGAEVEGEGRIE